MRSLGTASTRALGALLPVTVLAGAWTQGAGSGRSAPRNPSSPRAVASDSTTTRPAALLALQRYRETKLRRARIEWTIDFRDRMSRRHRTSLLANGDHLFIERGDDDGVTGMSALTGAVSKNPSFTLVRSNREVWHGEQPPILVSLFPAGNTDPLARLPDPRTFDVDVASEGSADINSALWNNRILRTAGPSRFSTQLDGPIHVVTASVPSRTGGVTELKYWLDSQRGWSPVRTKLLVNGECRNETRIVVKQYDGVWFPASIARYRSNYMAGREPVQLISIDSLTAGGSLPNQLGPSDLGLDAGTNIERVPAGTRPGESLLWDGKKPVSHDEFHRRVKAGDLQWGTRFRQWLKEETDEAKAGPRNEVVEIVQRRQSEWRRLVEEMCERNAFTHEQRASALGILDGCRREAARYVEGHRAEFDDLDREIRQLRLKNRSKRQIHDAVHERQDELLRPIVDIEHTQLRPRLDALLTSDQRARNGSNAGS